MKKQQKYFYKLTDQEGYTRRGETNETKWGREVTHTASGQGKFLCSAGLIHFYQHPLIAALRNCQDAQIKDPVLWRCSVAGNVLLAPLKGGAKTVTTICKIKLPVFTKKQRVAFAILCVLEVYKEKGFVTWAENWLLNKDRSATATAKAAKAADYAARAADYASAKPINFVSLAKKALTYQ